jgi:CheY-like chemotaxis protein
MLFSNGPASSHAARTAAVQLGCGLTGPVGKSNKAGVDNTLLEPGESTGWSSTRTAAMLSTFMQPGDIPFILIIDDDPDQLALVEQAAMRAGGFRVMTAESGSEALTQLQTVEPLPDLVLTDLRMPDMNGVEFMQRARRLPGMADVPMIFLTSSGYNRDRILVHMAGGDGFYQKPIRFSELVAFMKVLPSHIPHHSDNETSDTSPVGRHEVVD